MCYINALDNTFAFQVVVKLHPPTPLPPPLVVRESGRLLVESEIFVCEIWNPGPWNPEYSSKNPESH